MAAPEKLWVFDESLFCQLLVEQLVDLWLKTLPQLKHRISNINKHK